MSIVHNTMTLRGLGPKRFKFTSAEEELLRDSLRRNGQPPAWYYGDSYDEPDANAPTFYEAMMAGDLR